MKTKNGNLVVTILITVVVVLLAGLMIAWQTGLFKGQKQQLNSGTEKINNELSSMADFDVQPYHGTTINGEALTDLIDDVIKRGPELSIAVQTLVNANKATPVTIYYNKALTTGNAINTSGIVTTLDQSSKSSDNYITPTSNFYGKVLKNSNNEVTGILFIQQK